MKNSHQNQRLRVPNGWTGEARSLVIQIETILNDLYAKIEKLKKEIEQEEEE